MKAKSHYALGAALVSLSMGPLSPPAVAQGGQHTTPQQFVDALHKAFGDHHVRAVHAKGIVLEGHFMPAPEARSLSKATLFAGGPFPATIRFSDFTGLPNIPDNSPNASPHGLAVKIQLTNGSTTDIVCHSFNGFPVANADEFQDLILALAASGPEAAKPTALDKFLESHPIAKTFLTTQKPPPVSFATLPYYGVNAFKFTDAAGKSNFVRYRFIPKAGEQFVPAAEVQAKGADYLQEEIRTRLAKGPAEFEWFAQISGQGDKIDDPSIAWPEDRQLVKLGTLTVERVAQHQSALEKTLLFLPSNVPAGIEPADPMIQIRSATYPVSFGDRQ
jgi:catalase